MDVLCLYFNNRSVAELNLCQMFINHLFSFPNNKTTPRVLFAGVYDWYSVTNPNVNVSSWNLHTSPMTTPYGHHDELAMYQNYKSLNQTIELKVKFVQHLFSEMGGVRENVTRLGVIFLDGKSLSYEERVTVPYVLQQQDTDIKIFIVMEHVKYEHEIIHLRDTLLVDRYAFINYQHILALALCNQCLEGWWKYEHSIGAESISCYLMLESTNGSDCKEAYSTCLGLKNANLVAIESRDELIFLRTRIYSYFNELKNVRDLKNFSGNFFLGLNRDNTSIARRFGWKVFLRIAYRPLVVNNWWPGKPSGGSSNKCAVWQFDWSVDLNVASNVSSDGGHFIDGWVDVDCLMKSYFILCEASLYRRAEDNVPIIIEPASKKSFNQALISLSFVKYKDNIVSISFNFNNIDFETFLQRTGYELFPLFDCGIDSYNPRYISYSKVCDELYDCSNWRDEDACFDTNREDLETYSNGCLGIHCCDGSCLLHRWVNDGEVDCLVCNCITGEVYNDESEIITKHLKRNRDCAFMCNDDKCIDFSQLNDGHVDCTGWEGPLDETIGKLETADTCYNQHGHRIWAPRCVYVRDRFGAVLGCRDMSHLENCTDFQCPVGYVKCPSTYCIPQHYVLDVKRDCPTGEDEQITNVSPCTRNFACGNSKVCLHPDLVCDGHPDCPHKDDEGDCDFMCPNGLRCVSGTVTVSTYNTSVAMKQLFLFSSETKYVDISGVDLSALDSKQVKLPESLVVLKLSNCKLVSVDLTFFSSFLFLQELDISYNQIRKLTGRDHLFYESQTIRNLNLSYNTKLVSVKYLEFVLLETLDLSYTGLSHLDTTFLNHLPILKHLNLSFSYIASFHKNLFSSRLNLQTLDLRGLPMDNFYVDFFNGLTISQHLYTDSFEMCCPQIKGSNIPYYTCHAPVEVISSCFDLIGANIQRVVFWVITVLVVLGNVIVVVYRVIWNRQSLATDYGQFMTQVGISDFIMGSYTSVITGTNYYYRNNYILYDKIWRESSPCKLAGFLATLSSESSHFFTFFITLYTLFIKKFTFCQIMSSKLGKILIVVFSWVTAFLLALTPVVLRFEINSSNAMCIGLPLIPTRLSGWEFSFGVFIVLNIFLCFLLGCGYIASFCCMSENGISQTESKTYLYRSGDRVVYKQTSMIALLNFIYWVAIGLIGLLTLLGHEINNDVYAWTTVIVIPIKSALNPILLIIPALMVKWEMFKSGKIMRQ